MKFVLNNREEEITKVQLSISELLDYKKLTFRMRVVKINGVLVSKNEYDTTLINEGDNVQIIYLMSGG